MGQIKSRPLLDRLQEYVKNGGSLLFFMGDKINVGFYNETLHRQYGGLFPVLISSRPTDPITLEERIKRKLDDPQPKILFRDPGNPIVAGELAGKNEGLFRYLSVDRYYPALPRSEWNPANEKEKVEEIITLPNRSDVNVYAARAQELARQAVDKTEELAKLDKNFEKYKGPVEAFRGDITRALSKGQDFKTLYFTILELNRLLKDPGEPTKPERPDMTVLWGHPNMGVLRESITNFINSIQYGDPLVVVRPYGRGKVAACMTTAGVKSEWNDWAEGPLSWTYVIFFKKLLRNLNSESADLNRLATAEAGIKLQFDATQFKEAVKFWVRPQPDPEVRKGPPAGEPPDPEKNSETITMRSRKAGDDQFWVLEYNKAQQPGVYTFEFDPTDPRKAKERRSYAFNIDTSSESDLKRASREQLVDYRKGKIEEARAGQLEFGDDIKLFKAKDPDVSESPWLYLLFLIILVVEQALAVHLSFHVNPADSAAPARPARPAPAAA